ncbi:MAG: hypothetical protein U5K43_06525 [Halofilum sp. (in: g-proteobacteria)]|nr:hypothetical protein [Halofilum sp. (in: g-proteobacteria)]
MEEWQFPPDYDDGYFPDASSRYWFPERETMDAGRGDGVAGRLARRSMRSTPGSTRRSTGASGRRPASIPTRCARSRTSRSACR